MNNNTTDLTKRLDRATYCFSIQLFTTDKEFVNKGLKMRKKWRGGSVEIVALDSNRVGCLIIRRT